MKKVLSVVLTVAFFIGMFWLLRPVFFEEFFYVAPPTIKYTEAKDYVGQEVVIEDDIKLSNVDDDGNVYMVLGAADKSGVVILFPFENEDLKIPEGDDRLRVNGTIVEDQGVYGIAVEDNSQVKVVEK